MDFLVKGREGSHVTLEKRSDKGIFRTTIPLHSEIGLGLLKDIMKQAGYTRKEFLKLIKKS